MIYSCAEQSKNVCVISNDKTSKSHGNIHEHRKQSISQFDKNNKQKTVFKLCKHEHIQSKVMRHTSGRNNVVFNHLRLNFERIINLFIYERIPRNGNKRSVLCTAVPNRSMKLCTTRATQIHSQNVTPLDGQVVVATHFDMRKSIKISEHFQ